MSNVFTFENGLLMALDVVDNNRDPGEAREKILRILDSYREQKYKEHMRKFKSVTGIAEII